MKRREQKDEETGVDEGMKMGGGQFFPSALQQDE